MSDITGYYEFYDNQNFVGELQILKVEANGSLVGNLANKPIQEGVFNDSTGQIFSPPKNHRSRSSLIFTQGSRTSAANKVLQSSPATIITGAYPAIFLSKAVS